HHRIDDRIIAADLPRGDEFGRRIVKLLQPLSRTQRSRAILRIFRQPVSEGGGIEIQETDVVILHHLPAKQTRVPQLSPTPIAFDTGPVTNLPAQAPPQAARAERPLLPAPRTRPLGAFGEGALPAAVCGHLSLRSLRDDRPPSQRRAIDRLAHQLDRFTVES